MKSCAASLVVAAFAGVGAAQPVQWHVEDGGNGHWYELVRTGHGVTWGDAYEIALAVGGHLATCTSFGENQFVFSLTLPTSTWPSRIGPWLGGFQLPGSPEPSGGWRWVTDEAWDWTSWYGCCEPNNAVCNGLTEEMLHFIQHSAGWNDLSEEFQHCESSPWGYIVEWSADCNNDGIVDKGQILSGQLPDANNNGIPDGGPTITAQPVDQNVGVDSPVTFIVEVASDPSCTTPVTFQWQRRNPTVADPAAASAWIDLVDGGGFFGTRAPNLSISRPIPGLATGYRCKIGGGCGCEPGQGGFVYTNTVNFSVACPADFNADGGIDGLDLFAFFERWENGC